ncbi:MAG: bifunctional oligoribonuclease/PAP phosphatase NrnA [Victivallaceae bacterium]|nr:bifunctional oligoribonuclease/PAP phosphatase NrnA [Victivallaceae bacterium]
MRSTLERESYTAAAKLIGNAGRVLISGHLSPDGDSLGSMIALAKLLNNAGIEACATADVNALGKPGFLAGCEKIIPVRKLKHQKKKFDLFIAVDNSGFERMPPEVKPVAEKLPRICIDHHVTNNAEFAEVSIVDPEASSAGELVWRFAKWMEWKLDTEIAEALWVALITDSGRFAYDSTKPGTLRAAGDLLKHGVRTALINDIIYGSFSRKAIELKRIAWRSLHVWKNHKVAEVTLSRDDFRDVRGTKADAEDVIEIPRSVARNEIALFFYQVPDRTKETRCSIRTRGDWDATELAGRFGGGGHRKAAGCTIKAPLASAKRQMRNAVKDLLKNACKKTARIESDARPPEAGEASK